MKPASLLPILLILPCLLTAQDASNWQAAERAKLLNGVESVPKLGSPGPVAIWGNFAFPVLAAADGGKAELAVAAAAGFGKGKAVIFGHNSYLDGSESGVGTLLLNAVHWCSTKQKPHVGVFGCNADVFLKTKGLRPEKIKGPLLKKNIKEYDVVIANVQSATSDDEGRDVQEYIKAGGGFIAGMTGWAFEQTSGGKTLNSAHGLNKGLMPIGIGFTDTSAFGNATLREFTARTNLPKMMNAFEAITAMNKQSKGGAALAADDINQGASAIQVALAAQPTGRTSLQEAVMAALGDGSSGVPTPQKPLTQANDSSARIRLGMETRVLKIAAGAEVQAHAAASAFPGLAPADAPRVKKAVLVNPAVPGWTSTGLWADAGEAIELTMPKDLVGKGYAVRIGCHTDTLYHLETWSRAPDISRSQPIESEQLKTASAFGGLVYIEVPGKAAADKPFTVTIAGCVEAPLFVLGKDTDVSWNNELKKRPAPWAEFACDKIVLACPTVVARKVVNPVQLMEFWKKVVEAQDDIANQTAERKRPERIVCDVQISAGYMHSGYPIMVPVSAAEEMVTYTRIKFPGWGFYHELGHNHQRGDFTFEGTGEVTNNVLGMWVYVSVLKKDMLIGHTAIAPDEIKKHIRTIKSAQDKFAVWKKEPFTALTTYIQLIEGFGWESWRKYLYSFADPAFGPAPEGDNQRRDQFLIRYSKIVNKNLGPFFDDWGIPVSTEAKAQVLKLPAWSAKGM